MLKHFRNYCRRVKRVEQAFQDVMELYTFRPDYFIDILNLTNPERGRGSPATEGESKDREDISATMALQGVLSSMHGLRWWALRDGRLYQ